MKPSVVGGHIADPSHPGHPIRPEGTSVVWDSYWIAMQRRGDVIVLDVLTDMTREQLDAFAVEHLQLKAAPGAGFSDDELREGIRSQVDADVLATPAKPEADAPSPVAPPAA